jgi:formate hydrogenlyase subunit 3/multisubunit Na+/H+ antiporter MnhD subunit
MNALAALLMLACFLVPLGMLAACLSARWRAAMPGLLGLAPLPGLAAALLASGHPLVLDPERFRFTLELDAPAALLLGVASLLWSAAGLYAGRYLGREPGAERFAAWWLLTLSGSLGVFIAGDLVSFYLAFAVVSLAAFGLVTHDRTEAARRAGAAYILLAVLGEVCLLLGFALLAAAEPSGSLAIRDVLAGLADAPGRGWIITLLILGFGLKAGLVPLHVWLPLAHPAAPMPASAVLSGAIIKAGVIGLIRFLPDDGSLADAGAVLAVLGFATAFYAVAVGILQANPKTVLAYSSVSQMGVVAAALGLGIGAATPGTALAVAFYAAHHVLAKGALFLAVGVAAGGGPARRWVVLLPALVLALGFGGLPLTGGWLAKAAVKDQMGEGLVALLAALSASGSTLLMLHFVARLSATASHATGEGPRGLRLPWLGMAGAAILLPWLLFAPLGAGALADALAASALWKALWPVLIGVACFAALHRWGGRLPVVPEGDVLVYGARMARALTPCASVLARAEAALRAWPAAGLSMLLLALAFGAAMALARP